MFSRSIYCLFCRPLISPREVSLLPLLLVFLSESPAIIMGVWFILTRAGVYNFIRGYAQIQFAVHEMYPFITCIHTAAPFTPSMSPLRTFLNLESHSLIRNTDSMLGLLHEVLCEARFDDRRRLMALLTATKYLMLGRCYLRSIYILLFYFPFLHIPAPIRSTLFKYTRYWCMLYFWSCNRTYHVCIVSGLWPSLRSPIRRRGVFGFIGLIWAMARSSSGWGC